MANSRYDNIRVYYNGSFIIPNQIKVYNGSSWVDLGTKNSYSTKKLNVLYNNNFICATYYRNDVNIPKSIQIGKNKYADLLKSDNSNLGIDTYNAGYVWEMEVSVNKTTPLHTAYTKNNGDISISYVNYYLEVNNGRVRLAYRSRFKGTDINTRKYVDSDATWRTSYAWNTGDIVKIRMTRSSTNGHAWLRVYNTSGNEIASVETGTGGKYEPKLASGSSVYNIIGAETVSDSGSTSTYGDGNVYAFKFTPGSNRSNVFKIGRAHV